MANDFTNKVMGWSRKAQRNLRYVVKGSTYEFFCRLVDRTPVDTGRARGNWEITVTSGYKGESTNYDPNRFDKTGDATKARAWAVLEEAVGKRAYIVNNTPYFQYLDKGWSQQAPHGIIQVTVSEFGGIASGYARKAD